MFILYLPGTQALQFSARPENPALHEQSLLEVLPAAEVESTGQSSQRFLLSVE